MSDNGMNPLTQPSSPGINSKKPVTGKRRKSVRWVDEEKPGTNLAQTSYIERIPVMEPDARDWKRTYMISEGLPHSIIPILMTRIFLHDEECTLEHACYTAAQLYDRPSDYLIQAIESRLEDVSVDDQRVLFDYLGWDFTCRSCGLRWPATDFLAADFVLSDQEGKAALSSGPCGICSSSCAAQRDARISDHITGIMSLTTAPRTLSPQAPMTPSQTVPTQPSDTTTPLPLCPIEGNIETPISGDPLSISSTLIGLIATSTRAVLSLAKAPHQTARSAARSFKLSAQLLFKVLRTLEAGGSARPDPLATARSELVELDVLVLALTEAVLVFSKMASSIDAAEASMAEFGLTAEEALHRCGGKMDECAGRIAAVEKVITKLLSVLQVGDEAEATRHYAQAKALSISILSSSTDNDLPSRLHLMTDTFHCLTHIPPTRLAAIAPAPPPGYSIRTPVNEEPPTYAHSSDEGIAISVGLGTIFAGLLLSDSKSLALVRIPAEAGELTWGQFFTDEYAASRTELLGEALSTGGSKGRSEHIMALLGLSEAA